MKFSEQGQNKLKELEGFEPNAVADLAGYKTIGYGHKVLNREPWDINSSYTMTKDEALKVMLMDVKQIEDKLNYYVKCELNQSQFDALVIFIYNIGIVGFLNSGVFKNVKEGNFKDALIPWAKWINISKQVTNKETGEVTKTLIPVKGLINRRNAEMEMFKT